MKKLLIVACFLFVLFIASIVNARVLWGSSSRGRYGNSYWNFYCNGICAFANWWTGSISKGDCVDACLNEVWKCDAICAFKIWWTGSGDKKKCIEECLLGKFVYSKRNSNSSNRFYSIKRNYRPFVRSRYFYYAYHASTRYFFPKKRLR